MNPVRSLLALFLSHLFWVAELPTSAQAAAAGEFAFEDFLMAPLRVHLLSASNAPNWHSTLTEKDIQRVLTKVNGIWAQAGVHFYLESLVREEAASQVHYEEFTPQLNLQWLPRIRPEKSRGERMFHLYYVKELPVNGIHFPEGNFVKETAALREVAGGIDEPLPRVTSHELGHALGLPHRQNETNLLASRTTGTALNREEIKWAREVAGKIDWIAPATGLLKRADKLYQAGEKVEARQWYGRLAGLPSTMEGVARAQQRSAE